MAVREQNRFGIGRIGVAPASRAGQIIGNQIANNAKQIIQTIEPLAKEQAVRRGQEEAEAVQTDLITGIDPATGLPKAYRQDNFQIDNQVYNEIIKDRFQDEIIKEIKIAAEEINTATLNSPNRLQAFTTRLNTRLDKMSENSVGWAKQFIETNGADYLAQTAKSIERQVAAQARAELQKDRVESYNDKLITIQKWASIGDYEKSDAIRSLVMEEIDRDASQNIISKEEATKFKQNIKVSSIPIKFVNDIYNTNTIDKLYEKVESKELSYQDFNSFINKVPSVFENPVASFQILNELNKVNELKPFVAEIKKLTKNLTNNDYGILSKASESFIENAKTDIKFKYNRTNIQLREERLVSTNVQNYLKNAIESDNLNQAIRDGLLSPEKINKLYTGYNFITATFVDSNKDNLFRTFFEQTFQQAFNPIYIEGMATDFAVTDEIYREAIKFATSDGIYNAPKSQITKSFRNFLKERDYPEDKINDTINGLLDLNVTYALIKNKNILGNNALPFANRDFYSIVFQGTNPLRSKLEAKKRESSEGIKLLDMQNNLVKGVPISNTKENSEIISKLNKHLLGIKDDNQYYNFILSEEGMQTIVSNEVAHLNNFTRPVDSTFIQIFQDLANGQLSDTQLKNAVEIYSFMRDKVDADGNLIGRFSNQGDGIDDETYATLEAFATFSEVYGDKASYDSVFADYYQSFINAERSNILARKLNIDVRDNPSDVNKALDERVREYLVSNYSSSNINRLTKVMSARARAFLVREGQPVNSFEAIIPVLDKFIAKEYPSNMGVIYDTSLASVDLNSKYSPIKAFGSTTRAKEALRIIENDFQSEAYIKYFNKYHDGKIPTFDIDNVKEKELSKSVTQRLLVDGVRTYLNTPLDLLFGVITPKGALNRFQTYGMNILDLVGLEDREDYYGPIIQLTPINTAGGDFDWRPMVQDFVGSEPYFIPEVDDNGDPIIDKNTGRITHVQLNPLKLSEEIKIQPQSGLDFYEGYMGQFGVSGQ